MPGVAAGVLESGRGGAKVKSPRGLVVGILTRTAAIVIGTALIAFALLPFTHLVVWDFQPQISDLVMLRAVQGSILGIGVGIIAVASGVIDWWIETYVNRR